MKKEELIHSLCLIAQQAGLEIMSIKQDFNEKEIQSKSDGSPVTIADMAANEIICAGIQSLDIGLPIVSEEGLVGNPSESDLCFLVDPLDGTKEFIKGNGMYTVNIALTRKKKNRRWEPIMGVVHAPEQATTWYGGEGLKATRQDYESIGYIHVGSGQDIPIIVGSASHASYKDKEFREDIGNHRFEAVGSSIKICRVAEGSADLSPRFGPTSCWDTAAAHAVLNSAGGELLGPNGIEIDYDLVNDFLNPWFIATYNSRWVDVWLKHQS